MPHPRATTTAPNATMPIVSSNGLARSSSSLSTSRQQHQHHINNGSATGSSNHRSSNIGLDSRRTQSGTHRSSAADTTAGLGYAYHVPTGGLLQRVRNSLSQFSDLFSEFNRFIAPAYHHDRCERSVHMRLYSMHKREFVAVFAAFVACFALACLIGVAGPPITRTTTQSATALLSNTSTATAAASANDGKTMDALMATGPFVMRTPLLTTYSQQLWLIAQLETGNIDDERFDKSFQVSVTIEALDANHRPILVRRNGDGGSATTTASTTNRTRHLVCERNHCDEFTVLHLGFLEYAHYIITVRFADLEGFHQRYHIKELMFNFKTYNPAFTQIEIWFRFIFLLFTFIVTCWYAHSLRKFVMYDWSIEQKWLSVLLPLLLFYNNPLFPLTVLMNSWLPGMLDALLQATFLCSLLLFWLCIYHGLRQNERKFTAFYLPKLIVIAPLWLCAVVLATWEKCNELRDPTYSHFVDAANYNTFKTCFYLAGVMYLMYLALLILKAYSELRSMPFFDMRLKFLTLLMLFVLSVTLSVTMSRFGIGILEDNFVASLNTTYTSSAQFMCFYGLLNFYLYTMAYVYSPSGRPMHEPTITKDNPAFSMMNDSDEEVIYGSDEESRKPLNGGTATGQRRGNEYDSD